MPHSSANLKKMSAVNHTYSKFKDFKDHFQNSRTFQGSSKIATEIQALFKDFNDLSGIPGFQGFFQGCGHPACLLVCMSTCMACQFQNVT